MAHFTELLGTYKPPAQCNTDIEPESERQLVIHNNDSANDALVVTPETQKDYVIPQKFESIASIMNHWKTVANMELKHKSKWRVHLKQAERKRFTRVKRIALALDAKVTDADSSTANVIIQAAEECFVAHKGSLKYLADKYIKTL